jgi:hypothetical protein
MQKKTLSAKIDIRLSVACANLLVVNKERDIEVSVKKC